MNSLNRFIITIEKEGIKLDGRYTTGDDATVVLKKALRKSQPRKNPNICDAEMSLNFKGRKTSNKATKCGGGENKNGR